MTDQANRPTLPMEVIYEIIDLFGPENAGAILAPSDPRTKTFVSFTKVCRATCAFASVYLWRYCVYIDSDVRLQQFLQGLQAISVSSGAREGRRNVSSMYLAPVESPAPRCLHPNWLQLSKQINEVFRQLGGTLKRLVLDVPVRSSYDCAFEVVLHEGLRMLTGLEEFVAVDDTIFAMYTEGSILSMCAAWPKLRRLAVLNHLEADVFSPSIASMAKLASLLLVTNGCAIHGAHCFDQQQPWLTRAQQQSRAIADPEQIVRFARDGILTVGYPGGPVWEDPTRLDQHWLACPAIQGTLWGWVSELCCGSGELFTYKGWAFNTG